MKDEPWRGDPSARCLHLEGKLERQKARITELEAVRSARLAAAEKLAEAVDGIASRCAASWIADELRAALAEYEEAARG